MTNSICARGWLQCRAWLVLVLAALAMLCVGGCAADAGDEEGTEAVTALQLRRESTRKGSRQCPKDKVRICHFEGKKHSARIIEIPERALPAHLAHGDGLAPDSVETNADCLVPQPPPEPVSVSGTTGDDGVARFVIPETNIRVVVAVVDVNEVALAGMRVALGASGNRYLIVVQDNGAPPLLAPALIDGDLLDARPGSAPTINANVTMYSFVDISPRISPGEVGGMILEDGLIGGLLEEAIRKAAGRSDTPEIPPQPCPCSGPTLRTVPPRIPDRGTLFSPGDNETLEVFCGTDNVSTSTEPLPQEQALDLLTTGFHWVSTSYGVLGRDPDPNPNAITVREQDNNALVSAVEKGTARIGVDTTINYLGSIGFPGQSIWVPVICRAQGAVDPVKVSCPPDTTWSAVDKVCKCPDGTTACGGECVNDVCTGGSAFDMTTCACSCPAGTVKCGGQCVSDACTGGTTFDTSTCTCSCPSGTVSCNGQCMSNACGGGTLFSMSSCACECPQGTVDCQGTCTSYQCSDGKVLSPTSCLCECPSATTECNGQCVPQCTNGQALNTATCACECPSGTATCGGQCVSNTCPPGEAFEDLLCRCVPCPPGTTQCNGQCVSDCTNGEVLDPATCSCGCPSGTEACGGQCVSMSCQPGYAWEPLLCQCVPCLPGDVVCNGQCVSDCTGGQVLDPATCACKCPPNTTWNGQACSAQAGRFVVTTGYNYPNNAPGQTTTQTTFSVGSSAWGLRVTSSIGSAAATTTLDMTNSSCDQRSNGVQGSTRLDVYVEGPPGTPFRVGYDWNQMVSADATGAQVATGAGIDYSSFGGINAYAEAGQVASKATSGQGVDTGFTSATSVAANGVSYSLARSYQLHGVVVPNGCCATCSSGQTTSTVSAVILPP